jgi:Zn-dependent peptidase ImmA (M78 family)
MSASVEGINQELFIWARKSIGLSVEDVAIKMKRSIDDILSWENGASAPTYPQLEKLAYSVYKRPIALFFFPEPPYEYLPNQEFRSLPDSDLNNLMPDTYLNIRKGHAYQLAIKEIYNERNPSETQIWKSVKLNVKEDIQAQAHNIRSYLQISNETQSKWNSDDIALKEWRHNIESCGIFIFKSSFKQKDISGFCLTDSTFPIIYLNNSTTKTRQIFSLLHELAHILIDVNGLSKFDNSYYNQLPTKQKKIEVFCNAIAAEVLIPNNVFSKLTSNFQHDVSKLDDSEFEKVANYFSVSRESILRRFLDVGRVSTDFYLQKTVEWNSQMKKQTGGGSWYATTSTYLSEKFSREVISKYYKGEVSKSKASEFLGIKPKNFAGLEQLIMKAKI